MRVGPELDRLGVSRKPPQLGCAQWVGLADRPRRSSGPAKRGGSAGASYTDRIRATLARCGGVSVGEHLRLLRRPDHLRGPREKAGRRFLVLNAKLLLHIRRGKADTTSEDSLVRRSADEFWRWTGQAPLGRRFYCNARSLALDGPAAVLHGNAVVADGENCLRHVGQSHRSAWAENTGSAFSPTTMRSQPASPRISKALSTVK